MSSAVHDMFQSISRRYDLANDVLSFGTHRLWRRHAVRFAGLKPGMKVLDLCCGTGDFAAASQRVVGSKGTVVGMDFVDEMVDLAQQKYRDISFLRGDAMRIEFPDQSFNAVTIGFGIRNVDEPLACLKEMYRVLEPGGTAVVLEFGRPFVPGFRSVYQWYSKHLMPKIGEALTANRAAYEYLPQTAATFPAGNDFLSLMNQSGLISTRLKPLFAGVAYIYCGIRPLTSHMAAQKPYVH